MHTVFSEAGSPVPSEEGQQMVIYFILFCFFCTSSALTPTFFVAANKVNSRLMPILQPTGHMGGKKITLYLHAFMGNSFPITAAPCSSALD